MCKDIGSMKRLALADFENDNTVHERPGWVLYESGRNQTGVIRRQSHKERVKLGQNKIVHKRGK
jgi:hypothetical protein